MKMMPAFLASNAIGEVMGRWEYPLPVPLFTGVRILAIESVRQCNAIQSFPDIVLMLTSNPFDMSE